MNLKEIRISNGFTQSQAALLLNVSLRSYKSYENDESKVKTFKYKYLCDELSKMNVLDEEHGVLSFDRIKKITAEIFSKYDVNFCYLFGSYAKNCANDESDVDLLIDTTVTGLDFFGLVEELREKLCKKIDLLKVNQLDNNPVLLKEILKDGIKIYG